MDLSSAHTCRVKRANVTFPIIGLPRIQCKPVMPLTTEHLIKLNLVRVLVCRECKAILSSSDLNLISCYFKEILFCKLYHDEECVSNPHLSSIP